MSRQIINELRDLTDVYSVLSVLDVLIGFISSTGPDKDCLVHEYLHKTLKMPEERGLVSATARRNCCLKHTLSLWRTLMVEKGKRLVASHGVRSCRLAVYFRYVLLIFRIFSNTFLTCSRKTWVKVFCAVS